MFDQPVPSDWDIRGIYTGDAPGTESKALASGFGAAQLSEIGNDYFVLTQAMDTIQNVKDDNAKRIAAGQGPIIGTSGFLKGLGQEITFIGRDVLNTLFGACDEFYSLKYYHHLHSIPLGSLETSRVFLHDELVYLLKIMVLGFSQEYLLFLLMYYL